MVSVADAEALLGLIGTVCDAGIKSLDTEIAYEKKRHQYAEALANYQRSLGQQKAKEAELNDFHAQDEKLRSEIEEILSTSRSTRHRLDVECDDLTKSKVHRQNEVEAKRNEWNQMLLAVVDLQKAKGYEPSLVSYKPNGEPEIDFDQIELRLQEEVGTVKVQVAVNKQLVDSVEMGKGELGRLQAEKMENDSKLAEMESIIVAIDQLQSELAQIESESQAKRECRLEQEEEEAELTRRIESTTRDIDNSTNLNDRVSGDMNEQSAWLARSKKSHTEYLKTAQSKLSVLESELKEAIQHNDHWRATTEARSAAMQLRRSEVEADGQLANEQIDKERTEHCELADVKIQYRSELTDNEQAKMDLKDILASISHRRKVAKDKLVALQDEERKLQEQRWRANRCVASDDVDLVSKKQRQTLTSLSQNGEDSAASEQNRRSRHSPVDELRDDRVRPSNSRRSGGRTRRAIANEDFECDRMNGLHSSSAALERGLNGNADSTITSRTIGRAIQARNSASSDMNEFEGQVDTDSQEEDDDALDSEAVQSLEAILAETGPAASHTVYVDKEDTKYEPGNIVYRSVIRAHYAQYRSADGAAQKKMAWKIVHHFVWLTKHSKLLPLPVDVLKKVESAFLLDLPRAD